MATEQGNYVYARRKEFVGGYAGRILTPQKDSWFKISDHSCLKYVAQIETDVQ